MWQKSWIDGYIKSVNEGDRKKIRQNIREITFKFDGGSQLKSNTEYCLPAAIARKEVTIKMDVVDSDIPLLLSQSAMKKAGVKIYLENDSATIFGKDVALNLTTSGQYCIPIYTTEEIAVEGLLSVKLDDMDRKEKYTTLNKLSQAICASSSEEAKTTAA